MLYSLKINFIVSNVRFLKANGHCFCAEVATNCMLCSNPISSWLISSVVETKSISELVLMITSDFGK